ncbi:MAG: GDP-mannose 4,6-dehydratase, partial [Polaromonas sp.]|nr:GDP-mannose 4,6-dehydratase [Polaromonas sp.]
APDAVVHLAAISFVGHADNSAFYAVNVVGTTNLLTALVALPKRPTRVLLASSANVYGNTKASPIVETQSPAPINHYGMSKLAMELMAMTYAAQLGLVITRPFNYTGRGQSTNFIVPKLVTHFARKAPSVSLGNLAVAREFNDVQMVCDAYLQLLKHGKAGETYNVCSGQPYTLQHVIDTLARITGHQLEVVIDPTLVRANELPRLCGSPAKLQALLVTNEYVLDIPPLERTLRQMLNPAGLANCARA